MNYNKVTGMLLAAALVVHLLQPGMASAATTPEQENPDSAVVEQVTVSSLEPSSEEVLQAASVEAEQLPEADDPIPEQTVPEETLPEQAIPEASLPDESLPEETLPEETLPEQTVPEEMLPVDPMPVWQDHDEMPMEAIADEEQIPPVTMHDIPLYFQNDYPDTMYGYGTVESSGCSITSLAMVATYLTGYDYLPDVLAGYFGGRAANNMARMEYGCDALQLPYTKNTNWHETLAALQEGKIAIVLLNKNSAFTNSQHFVVLTGITDDGLVMVNDPYLPNYGKSELVNGFVDGFATGYLSNGYSGGWVFDPMDIPDDIPYYYEEPLERPEPRYEGIHLDQADRQLLARVVWVEAQGESFEGQQAVAEVVLNRMADPRFPSSVAGVIYAEGQFRSVKFLDEATPSQTQYEAIDRALFGPYVLPKDVFHFATFRTNENVWGQIGGHIFCYHG